MKRLLNVYAWSDNGNYVGSLGSLKTTAGNSEYLPLGKLSVALYHDYGDAIIIGSREQNASSSGLYNIVAKMVIDDKHKLPHIAGTASGVIKIPGNGTITVEQGLITSWDIKGGASGDINIGVGDNDNLVEVENGIIKSWNCWS